MIPPALKEACWYWSIAALVFVAMYVAETPLIFALAYHYWCCHYIAIKTVKEFKLP